MTVYGSTQQNLVVDRVEGNVCDSNKVPKE